MTSSSPEFGEAQRALMVDYSGPAVQVCFNAQYVLDFLGAVETDEVALEFKDDVSQALMRPGGRRRDTTTSTSSCRCGSD